MSGRPTSFGSSTTESLQDLPPCEARRTTPKVADMTSAYSEEIARAHQNAPQICGFAFRRRFVRDGPVAVGRDLFPLTTLETVRISEDESMASRRSHSHGFEFNGGESAGERD